MSDQPDQAFLDQFPPREQARRRLLAAREAHDREAYRLQAVEVTIEMIQKELSRLESASVTGLLSALTGSKAAKVDARREEIAALQEERESLVQAVETLRADVEQLHEALAAFGDIQEEAVSPQAAPTTPADNAGPVESGLDAHALEQALETGESLVQYLEGMSKACNRMRQRPSRLMPGGIVLAGALQVVRNRNANALTGQVGDAVAHFCRQLDRLNLSPERLPDILMLIPRLQQYTQSSSLSSSSGVDAWADLEAMVRSVVSDLQDELRRQGR